MNNNRNLTVQERFLSAAHKQGTLVTLYMLNGYQMKGIIREYDADAILFESSGVRQLVYKHAVSTIAPVRKEINTHGDRAAGGYV